MGQLFPYSFAGLRPLGFVTAAVAANATTELTVPAGTKGALVQATGSNLNWRDDGHPPTSAVGGGMLLVADAEPSWFGNADLEALSFIAVGTGAHILVSFYG